MWRGENSGENFKLEQICNYLPTPGRILFQAESFRMWPKGGPKEAGFSLPVTTPAFKKPPSSNNRALLDTQCTAISTSNSPDSETMRNVLVLFVRYLVYDIVAKQHSQTKTESMLKNFTVWLLVLYYSITAFTKQTQWLCSTPTHFLRFWGSGREAQLRV